MKYPLLFVISIVLLSYGLNANARKQIKNPRQNACNVLRSVRM